VTNWAEHQKPQHPGKDAFASPASAGVVVRESPTALMQPSCITHETLTPELSRDGFEVEKGGHLAVTVTFEDFWAIWGKKVAKAEAQKAWKKAVRTTPGERILEGARVLWDSPWRPAKQFIPHPATWLNREQWNDPAPEPPEDERRAEKPTPIAVRKGSCDHRFVGGWCAECSEREPNE